MSHVQDRLAARLGGELDRADTAAFDAHLAACPACAAAFARARAAWDLLGSAVADASAAPSAWPVVRSRTFGTAPPGLLPGHGPWRKTGIAAVALAAGLALALLLPSGGVDRTRTAAPGAGSFWLEDAGAGSLAETWLAAAGEETS